MLQPHRCSLAAGFKAGGVKAGSTAAFGNVAAGSIFASLQSAGVLDLIASTKAADGVAAAISSIQKFQTK